MAILQEQFGEIDIYLFDQLLRGRIHPGMKILDAGCGGGRNLVYLLREDYDVSGVDLDLEAIQEVRRFARRIAPNAPGEKFKLGTLESLTYPDASFDFVICNAVLHFAAGERHFLAMLHEIWRVLKPGGILFCRLASSIGMERQIKRLEGRRYLLPDGSERFLVDAAFLEKLSRGLKGELLDPLKTTLVHKQRCMTTWVIRKPGDR